MHIFKKEEKMQREQQAASPAPEIVFLEKKHAEKELQHAKHLFTYESKYNDDRDFFHYSKEEYFLTYQRKILVKENSCIVDMHSITNSSSYERYYYVPFEYLNNHIRNYNIPEANKYLGISEKNCEQFF